MSGSVGEYSETNVEIKQTGKLKNWVKPDEECTANETSIDI